ncbi:hypothetical protein J2Y48_003644 [Mycoplana sp. BE70]|uniref:GFA family protein n=1 Tax=Mycoplana sp. BE70 TaxID=2817775 RepID=UPI002860343D|nr:GFA family protein [Mycoplana sp. BE70]MDR6758345.1 hypothetical protein [Mycoplana sp. BE70]
MLRGRCHCGDTVFEIDGELPQALTRCTCSFCSKRGQLYAYYEPGQLRIVGVPSHDSIYRWNTGLVAHHFCAACGCGTYTDSPAFEIGGGWDGVSRRIGINARLFDDFDAAEAPVTVIDGKNLW